MVLMLCVGWLAAAFFATAAAPQASSYAGHQRRQVKALSAEDVQALLEGQGMGLARAAELNHYPGPKHVLELAEPLGLSAAQQAEVARIHQAMLFRARELGRRILEEERALDRLFADQRIAERTLRRAVARIARLQGELRAVHLLAHLHTRARLTAAQVQAYDRQRGYGDGAQHPHGHQR